VEEQMEVLTALGKLYERFGREYRPYEVVCKEADTDTDMYFVLAGGAEVLKAAPSKEPGGADATVTLATLGVGDFFGEMELLLGVPRSATVRAASDGMRVVRLSPGNFDTIVKIQPQIAIQMLKTIALRLQNTSAQLANTK